MDINELTLGQVKELVCLFGTSTVQQSNVCAHTLTKKGDKVFIRTLTYHYTGRVVNDNGVFIELEDCCWIADSGRFSTAIGKGELKEVEPIGNAKILYSNIVDCIKWDHELPSKAK